MGIFDFFNVNKDKLEEELKGLESAQKALDERLEKRQVSNETYRQKSMEFMLKREKIQKKLSKLNN